jgi:hypothetical protein
MNADDVVNALIADLNNVNANAPQQPEAQVAPEANNQKKKRR